MDSAFRNSILSDSKKKEASELKRYFDIEVLPSDTQPIVESKIKKIAKTMKAPGFRPGKVPIDIVKQTHELEVQSDAINEVINNYEDDQKLNSISDNVKSEMKDRPLFA